MLRLVVIFLLFISNSLFANPDDKKITRSEYIEKYKEEAIREMHIYGIPASITLSQGMLESDNGNSPLGTYANNHFGIKCSDWTGPTYRYDDDELNECFRKYSDAFDSFKDHSKFLRNRPRYSFLFDYSSTDYKSWAQGLKKAGYATNPKYPELLIKIIEDNNLAQYDTMKPINAKTKHIHLMDRDNQVLNVSSKQEIALNNNIKYVFAKESDTYFKIAEDNKMGLWQIRKYNEIDVKGRPQKGDVIYLQPKRNNSKEFEYHIAKLGQTLYEVSQQYGVKLKKLRKFNNIGSDDYVAPGQKIFLRRP